MALPKPWERMNGSDLPGFNPNSSNTNTTGMTRSTSAVGGGMGGMGGVGADWLGGGGLPSAASSLRIRHDHPSAAAAAAAAAATSNSSNSGNSNGSAVAPPLPSQPPFSGSAASLAASSSSSALQPAAGAYSSRPYAAASPYARRYGAVGGLGGMGAYGSSMYGSQYGSSYGGYGGYGGGYGSSYGGFGGGYGSSYGGYGGGYGMGGMDDGMHPSSLTTRAEESSRTAFQAIENIVQAFGSVSMMLESTFHATYSSFRAVLGVADHFARLRHQLASIFSAIAVFRTVRYIVLRLLRAMGLRSPRIDAQLANISSAMRQERMARAPSVDANGNPTPASPKSKSWPIFLFVAVVFAFPWAIWRLLREEVAAAQGEQPALGPNDPASSATTGTPLQQQQQQQQQQPQQPARAARARALYDFISREEYECSFSAGDELTVMLPPNGSGWLRARVAGRDGYVPEQYVKVSEPNTRPPLPPPQHAAALPLPLAAGIPSGESSSNAAGDLSAASAAAFWGDSDDQSGSF
ncbi:peroxisome biogenesis factor 13 [Capsaspora owczarzaki ATCC 30864]|uniref:Peroxisomal membrane protein PEX13 n=1 Tax=Capsaspora owczarzaki (strain ATCC 30864) TaxID=595528 RepID=A0A0D2WSH0_CAPO3|nr:peroxisome biogenesis factor 13 [Capsaspora owczarzaki ATCC 30864]KJE94403.1 peroxisome biogenesis factor 13 [Capsaspora owczarzaki ATCC 30864]|eukprot:XP_004346731.2 peroxisome biogenesis factor 13 [Capsaspora owczarzaki ATCC 30864]